MFLESRQSNGTELRNIAAVAFFYRLRWLFPEPIFGKGMRRSTFQEESDRRHANREVQTVNWEGGGEGVVERGVKSSLKKAHKTWIRGKKGAQTVN